MDWELERQRLIDQAHADIPLVKGNTPFNAELEQLRRDRDNEGRKQRKHRDTSLISGFKSIT